MGLLLDIQLRVLFLEWNDSASLSGSVNYDYKRRFIDKIDGGSMAQYTSLLEGHSCFSYSGC